MQHSSDYHPYRDSPGGNSPNQPAVDYELQDYYDDTAIPVSILHYFSLGFRSFPTVAAVGG